MLESFLYSIVSISLAEMGDKTQLVCIVLAAHYRKNLLLCCALFFASIISHTIAAALGMVLNEFFNNNQHIISWITSGLFIIVGLIGFMEKDDDKVHVSESAKSSFSIFVLATSLFVLGEVGDKTMLATIAISAKYDNIIPIVSGATIGMLIANVPAIYLGPVIVKYLPKDKITKISSGLFIATGVIMLLIDNIK